MPGAPKTTLKAVFDDFSPSSLVEAAAKLGLKQLF
jgi:hypothetical protein